MRGSDEPAGRNRIGAASFGHSQGTNSCQNNTPKLRTIPPEAAGRSPGWPRRGHWGRSNAAPAGRSSGHRRKPRVHHHAATANTPIPAVTVPRCWRAKTSLPTRRPAVGSHESTDRIGPGPRAGERSGPTPGPVGVPASRSDTCAPLGLISVRSPSRNGRHRLITVVHPPQHCPRVRIDPNVAPQRRDATAGQISTQRHAVGAQGARRLQGYRSPAPTQPG